MSVKKEVPTRSWGGGVGSVEECEGKAEVVHMVSRHGGGGGRAFQIVGAACGGDCWWFICGPLPKTTIALRCMNLSGNRVFADNQVKVRP